MLVDTLGLRPADVLRAHGLDAASGSGDYKKLARYLKPGRRLLETGISQAEALRAWGSLPRTTNSIAELREGLRKVHEGLGGITKAAKQAFARLLSPWVLGNVELLGTKRAVTLGLRWADLHLSEAKKSAIRKDVVKATPVFRLLEAHLPSGPIRALVRLSERVT